MRQPAWAVTGFKNDRRTIWFPLRITLKELTRFLIGPCFGGKGGCAEIVSHHGAFDCFEGSCKSQHDLSFGLRFDKQYK